MTKHKKLTFLLLTATILVTSLFVSQDSFANVNKNSDQSPHKYKVEVIAKEKISESVVAGTKVVVFEETIRLIDKPTAEELIADNIEYLNFLENSLEDGKEISKEQRKKIKEIANSIKEEITLKVVKVGEHSITFGVETRDSPNGNVKDPVNMIWYDSGYANNVQSIIDDYADHGWDDASGGTQYVYIDNTAHGGIAYWQQNSYQLEEGEFLETRYHVRVFSGSYDSHGTYDEWSIGNVHKETWYGACSCHEIDSDGWELAEDELKDDMNGKTGVGTIGSTWLGNNDEYQGEDNDGYAVDMQLT